MNWQLEDCEHTTTREDGTVLTHHDFSVLCKSFYVVDLHKEGVYGRFTLEVESFAGLERVYTVKSEIGKDKRGAIGAKQAQVGRELKREAISIGMEMLKSNGWVCNQIDDYTEEWVHNPEPKTEDLQNMPEEQKNDAPAAEPATEDLEDFPAEGIIIARYNDPAWLAAHLPEGLEKLEKARCCSIGDYGNENRCYNLAHWQINRKWFSVIDGDTFFPYPLCEDHLKAMAEMNSDNEEYARIALEWHKSEVGKEETFNAYKVALSPFRVVVEVDKHLPEPYTHSWHIDYIPSGHEGSGGIAFSELDAYMRMYTTAMIHGYIGNHKPKGFYYDPSSRKWEYRENKPAQAEPEKTATISPEAVESFEDPTKPYINTDVLPTQVYIPADDSREARTVETEPVINFEYYPSFLIMRCPRCDKNYKTHLRPDWPALEVLATLLHSMDACPDCGRPGPEGLKRALLSAMHAEADRIENPAELAEEDEGSFSEMGYDPYSGGYSSDL